MLLNFHVANVLSFRDEQRISFIATERNDGSARQTGIRDHGREVFAVPTIVIYGANASGKSNMLAALRLMGTTVLESLGIDEVWGWMKDVFLAKLNLPQPKQRAIAHIDATRRNPQHP